LFKRCLLGSIILHILVIAGVGIGLHKAPLELDKVAYFQLVTDIPVTDFHRGRSGLTTAYPHGIRLAKNKLNSGSRQVKPGSTIINPTVQDRPISGSPISGSTAPDSGKSENEGAKNDVKPVVNHGNMEPGSDAGMGPGGSPGVNPGTSSGVVYLDGNGTSANGVPVTPPRRVYSPNPAYPGIAKRNNWEGLVILRVLVKTDGTIGEITVFQSSGYEVLDRSALQAVKKWRYQPALRRGTIVECYMRIPVRYQLGE
jgi:TonB family protein